MGIGPVFDCPERLIGDLEPLFAQEKIGVTRAALALPKPHVLFCKGLARIVAFQQSRNDRTLLWLTFPKAHAFNPLFWYFDFSLSDRIGRILLRSGAMPLNWQEFVKSSESN
jgi:hypothetical protein